MATVIAEAELATGVFPFEMTVEIYSKMVESGLIPEKSRVFLFDGRLFEKMAKSKAHGYVGASLTKALIQRLPEGWSVWPESTVVLNDKNAPLPDFSVIRGGNPQDFGAPDRYPAAHDVGILIEIAVSSLRYDLTTALELFARTGVPVYWVIDVTGRRVIVHAEPRVVDNRGVYSRVEVYQPGQEIPVELHGLERARVPIDELLR